VYGPEASSGGSPDRPWKRYGNGLDQRPRHEVAIGCRWYARRVDKKTDDNDGEMGDDNTVVGTPPRRMGSGNTIWNAGDANGSSIINGPGGFAFGRGAFAGPGSIAIGAGAGAGGRAMTVERRLTTVRAIVRARATHLLGAVAVGVVADLLVQGILHSG